MKSNDVAALDNEAIALAKQNFPDGRKFRILNILHFLRGELRVVKFEDPDDNNEYFEEECYVFHRNNERARFFADIHELAQGLGRHDERPMWERVMDLGGIAGLVAIIIVLTVVYLVIAGRDVPKILTDTLTIIIAFYFGTKVKK